MIDEKAKYLLDTNIIIDQLRDFRKVADSLERLSLNKNIIVGISTFTELEIYLGKSMAILRKQEEADELLDSLMRIPIDSKIAREAGKLKRIINLRTGDALIAATAILHKCTLVTGNAKHFQKIPKLRIIKPE